MKHVNERFGEDANKEVLLLCIGITSLMGRLIFGRAADYVNGVKKVYLQVRAQACGHGGVGYQCSGSISENERAETMFGRRR